MSSRVGTLTGGSTLVLCDRRRPGRGPGKRHASPDRAAQSGHDQVAAAVGLRDCGAAREVARRRRLVPSQSHAMQDVICHYTNLWFAGQKANWPLAQFYLNETRSHI